MYLKKLTLKGFKSFPDKTSIQFNEGVTAVVGPNGSGKSNISDAIRWVLGEQSVKSLRGEKMEDVIFSGTDIKPSMNYCEVSLTLDDSDNLIDENGELKIKRRAYRSGESEYFLNGKKCRLKDVRETLMDTGIGKDGYSIIEQGKVEEILSNNPSNKRKIFDEACGIAKYRYKKNEAENNLKKATDNLNRIVDIFTQIEEQVAPLERQKNKAEKYLEISQELKVLEVNDLLIQNKEVEQELNNISDKYNESKKEVELLGNEKNEIETELSEIEISLNTLDIKIDSLSEKSIDIKSAINENNNEINITGEKINSLLNNIEVKKNEIKNIVNKLEISNNEYSKAAKKADESSYLIESLESELGDIFESRLRTEKNLEVIKEKIDDNKNSSFKMLEKKEKIAKDISFCQANIENFQKREEEINDEIDTTVNSISNLKGKKTFISEKVENVQSEYAEIEKCIDCEKKEIDETSYKLKKANDEFNRINISNSGLLSKKNTYIEMENHYEGFNRGVKEILKNKSISGVVGAFGELINVSKKYEKAIESTLGMSIQNVVVENEGVAKLAIAFLKKNNLGRVTFLPINVMRSNRISDNLLNYKNEPIGICSDLIDFDEKYRKIVENLLGRVLVFENIDKAIAFSKESNNRYKLVTLDGDILNPGGSMTGGSIKSSTNILSRKRIIQELTDEIKNNENILELSKNAIEKYTFEINNKKTILDGYYKKSTELKNKISEVGVELKLVENKILENTNLEQKLKSELEVNKNKIIDLEKEKSDLDIKFNEIIDLNLDNNSNINELEIEYEKVVENLNAISKNYNEKNLELARMKQAFENNISEIERIEKEILEFKNDEQESNKVIIDSEKDIDILDELVENLKIKLKSLHDEEDIISDELLNNRNEKYELKTTFDEKQRDLRTIDRNINSLTEEVYKIESRISRFETKIENLAESLFTKYELSFDEAEELRLSDIEIDKSRIDYLKSKIKSLGNINLDAIQEYAEVKEKYDFYKEQKEDMEESISSINTLIEDLIENMEKEFIDKFYVINENFKNVYSKLFGGGTANLSITDMDNILGCDIEITAQPPGKKMKNLSLLSGGEKALTAICILFGILISKPTPFCILDEIEAPLDDVNVYRFGEYLKELSEDTQFIAVTHRRGTMEVADYIYGVTMQEKGISSVLSIMLKEAREMIEE